MGSLEQRLGLVSEEKETLEQKHADAWDHVALLQREVRGESARADSYD